MKGQSVDLAYCHVDVFSRVPFGGNSLPVFLDAPDLTEEQMQRITQELRHFEAVFTQPTGRPDTVRARIFDLFEELPFAGHPIIGAAVALHIRSGSGNSQHWRFELRSKTVTVSTEMRDGHYSGWLDQGRPEFLGTVDDVGQIAHAFSLAPSDLDADLPLEAVSTGLRYLIVPVRAGVLVRARISHDITELLRGVNAQFAILFDESGLEVRHWNNDGVVEDVATGSAAGTIGAYRLRHGLVGGGEQFTLNQGQYAGRSSHLHVRPEGSRNDVETVNVGGDVAIVGHGVIGRPPS
ncbi:phenazine biosynthesis protein PhzF [Mycobacterium sp. Soil538]|nr:phenazine biosynthesis protein PhzF [Mycobacterium sp. Soil538]